jgi:hypothetical protein
MKRLVYFSLFLLFLSNCKEDKVDKSEVLKLIIGKWHSIEVEERVQENKMWRPIPAEKQVDIAFSFDGAILTTDREPGCCPPSAFKINGILFDIKSSAVNTYPCMTVLCGDIPALQVEINEDEMIISNGIGVRYARY